MVSFFPWLKLKADIRTERLRLDTFSRDGGEGAFSPAERTIIGQVTRPYWAGRDTPVSSVVILRRPGRDLFQNLEDEEVETEFEISELVTISGLAERRYFRNRAYWNRDNFKFVVQAFREENHRGVALQERRRDGGSLSWISYDHLVVTRPFHVPDVEAKINIELLRALLERRQRAAWRPVRDAVFLFNAGNRDTTDVRQETELVMLLSAFERLSGLTAADERQLVEFFRQTLQPRRELTPTDNSRLMQLDDGAHEELLEHAETVREVWLHDLYRLRNNLAHGQMEPGYPSIWSIREHLLLGSYVFPLVLKAYLAEDDAYSLTAEDHERIEAFEDLTETAPFDEEVHAPRDSSWYRKVRQHSRRETIRRAMQRFREEEEEGHD